MVRFYFWWLKLIQLTSKTRLVIVHSCHMSFHSPRPSLQVAFQGHWRCFPYLEDGCLARAVKSVPLCSLLLASACEFLSPLDRLAASPGQAPAPSYARHRLSSSAPWLSVQAPHWKFDYDAVACLPVNTFFVRVVLTRVIVWYMSIDLSYVYDT